MDVVRETWFVEKCAFVLLKALSSSHRLTGSLGESWRQDKLGRFSVRIRDGRPPSAFEKRSIFKYPGCLVSSCVGRLIVWSGLFLPHTAKPSMFLDALPRYTYSALGDHLQTVWNSSTAKPNPFSSSWLLRDPWLVTATLFTAPQKKVKLNSVLPAYIVVATCDLRTKSEQ